MNYRAEVDGLRAVAVLPVILYHAGIRLFGGGFVGVDIFFVISGYLITGILLDDLRAGKFSVASFYGRRLRRIFPALVLVLFTTYCAGLLWLSPSDLESLAGSIVAVTASSSNIFFWREAGYFSPDAELKPLLHTWSLAVEEQYYILFPFVLAMLWRRGRSRVTLVLGLCLFASLALAVCLAPYKPNAAFFLLPTRGWEVLIGALASIYLSANSKLFSLPSLNELAGLTGLALIVVSILTFDGSIPYPSLYTLIPTFGAALVILAAQDTTLVGRLLSSRVFVSIGLISYSAYLWHQPILAFARHRTLTELPPHILLLFSALSFPMAYLSWHYVEKPFRDPIRCSARFVRRSSIISVLLLVLLGFLTYWGNGFPKRGFGDTALMADIDEALRPNPGLSLECDSSFTESPKCSAGAGQHILLWGDSFAMHLVQALQQSPTKISLRQFTMSTCRPVLNLSVLEARKREVWASDCVEHNDKVLAWIRHNPQVKYIVMASPFVFTGDKLLVDGKLETYDKEVVYQHLATTLTELRRLGRRVVIVSPPPSNGNDLGACVRKAYQFNAAVSKCNFPENALSQNTLEGYELLRRVEDIVPILWLQPLICKEGSCTVTDGGLPVYRDRGHLSARGSALLGEKYDLSGRAIQLADAAAEAIRHK